MLIKNLSFDGNNSWICALAWVSLFLLAFCISVLIDDK
jgi:hypothetical protein